MVVFLMLSLNSFKKYEELVKKLGAVNAKIINASEVEGDNRSRLKCRFGCSSYFVKWTIRPAMEFNLGLLKNVYFPNILSRYYFMPMTQRRRRESPSK